MSSGERVHRGSLALQIGTSFRIGVSLTPLQPAPRCTWGTPAAQVGLLSFGLLWASLVQHIVFEIHPCCGMYALRHV